MISKMVAMMEVMISMAVTMRMQGRVMTMATMTRRLRMKLSIMI